VPGPSVSQWCLVVPVKRLALAKTRLAEVAGEHRVDLALAFALDTATAALACDVVRAVVVVTNEPDAARALTEIGALVVSDAPDAGLNPALVHGANVASRAHPGTAVGALSADLPALRSDELSAALGAAPETGTAFVRDALGIGTTTLLARRRADFVPAFGPESASCTATRSRRCAATSTQPPISRRHWPWVSARTQRPSRVVSHRSAAGRAVAGPTR
jgi:2-phospho-L-lactate guanylyltransferase